MLWLENKLKKLTIFLTGFMEIMPEDLERIRERERPPQKPSPATYDPQIIYRFNR